jgi:AcrR family transcriptional regulator
VVLLRSDDSKGDGMAAALTVDTILDAAITLVGDGTPLGMRALAKRLGVSAPSLYHHIAGRDELVNLLRDRIATEDAPPPPTGDWRVDLRAAVNSQRRSYVRHPGLLPLLVATPITPGAVLTFYSRNADILERAGFPPRDVALIIEILDSFTIGSALEQAAPPGVWGPTTDDALTRAIGTWPTETDLVIAAFETGLDLIFEGLEARRRAGDPVAEPGS